MSKLCMRKLWIGAAILAFAAPAGAADLPAGPYAPPVAAASAMIAFHPAETFARSAKWRAV